MFPRLSSTRKLQRPLTFLSQWNAFVELLPLWLAPNLVTLLGFCFILGNVALLEVYIPDLVGPAPSWVYYSFAFGMWM